ncbi:MAG: phospholipase [Bacteroidota bacterium]
MEIDDGKGYIRQIKIAFAIMESHHIKVEKTAHYYTLGQVGAHIRHCWIVCHGYGQLADKFLEEFKQLEDGQSLVIAPEGLSRFYWGGFTGPIVSSWMTSKNRLDEIADYTRFIQSLYDHYIPQLAPNVRIHLLGFSQGTATQCRWILRKQPHFHNLILCSGFFPEDLDYPSLGSYWDDKQLIFTYGTLDRFLTPERTAFHEQVIREQQLEVEHIAFEGKHVIDQDVIKHLAERFRQAL